MATNEDKKNISEFKFSVPLFEKGLDGLKNFLERAIGPSVDELGLLFKDGLKIRRTRNMIKNFEKVKGLAEEHNIRIKQIDLKALFPYLEGVSLEENDELQDMWANLFLNYIDADKKMLSTVYPDILKHLSTKEAEILKYMYAHNGILAVGPKASPNPLNIEDKELQNLERLRIIEPQSNFSIVGDTSNPFIEEAAPDYYYTTTFGDDFISACLPRKENINNKQD